MSFSLFSNIFFFIVEYLFLCCGMSFSLLRNIFFFVFEYFFFVVEYYFFKKNLTNTKLTGTQMQNIGMGASVLLTPIHRKKLSVAICNR